MDPARFGKYRLQERIALGGTAQNNAQEPRPATSQSPTEEPAATEAAEPTESAEPTETTDPSDGTSESAGSSAEFTLPSYFVRDTPQGPELVPLDR